VVAAAVDGERVEEQGGETAAPPHVEEVVGGGARREVARHLARQRPEDERGVEVGGVVRDDDEGAARLLELLAPDDLDGHERPDDRLQDQVLRHEPAGRMTLRVEPVAGGLPRRIVAGH
jgi:hypothetical protein